jgi:hypothetical protein
VLPAAAAAGPALRPSSPSTPLLAAYFPAHTRLAPPTAASAAAAAAAAASCPPSPRRRRGRGHHHRTLWAAPLDPRSSRPDVAWAPAKRWTCCRCRARTIVEQRVCCKAVCAHRRCFSGGGGGCYMAVEMGGGGVGGGWLAGGGYGWEG